MRLFFNFNSPYSNILVFYFITLTFRVYLWLVSENDVSPCSGYIMIPQCRRGVEALNPTGTGFVGIISSGQLRANKFPIAQRRKHSYARWQWALWGPGRDPRRVSEDEWMPAYKRTAPWFFEWVANGGAAAMATAGRRGDLAVGT